MKKIRLFWWIFWLLWSFEATGPELIEARSWTNRSKSTSSSTYCDGSGKCSTSTTATEHKDNQPRYNPYGYSYGYAPSGPSWGPTYNVQAGDIVPVITCIFTFGLACPSSSPSPLLPQTNIINVKNEIHVPPPTIVERERTVERIAEPAPIAPSPEKTTCSQTFICVYVSGDNEEAVWAVKQAFLAKGFKLAWNDGRADYKARVQYAEVGDPYARIRMDFVNLTTGEEQNPPEKQEHFKPKDKDGKTKALQKAAEAIVAELKT